MGLLTNSYFYKKFDRSCARELSRQSLLMLGGLEDQRLFIAGGRRSEPAPTGERRARPKLPPKSKSLIYHLNLNRCGQIRLPEAAG
jgi:hypothetical protein